MNFTNRHFTNFMFVLLIAISSIIFSSCSTMSDHELKPGHSLGVASIPNLRDMGGYKTADRSHNVTRGLVYRSNQLNNISAGDMLLLAKLNLKNVFDLRTAAEKNPMPDELTGWCQQYLVGCAC
jgi:hypothetical protein